MEGWGAQSCGAEPLACKIWCYPQGRECQNRVEFLDTLLVLGTVYWRAAPSPRPCWNWVQEPSLPCLPKLQGNGRPHSQAAVTIAVAQDKLRTPGRCQGHSRTQAACQRPRLSAHSSVAQHTLQTQAPACPVGPGQPFPFHLSARPIPGTQLLMEGLDVPKEALGSGAQVCLPEQTGPRQQV